MAIETLSAPATPRIVGLRCRSCRRAEPIGLSYVCPACFGPLEVEYDYDIAARTLTRAAIAARSPGIWRYLELLPVDAPPSRGLPVGSTPLLPADRLAPRWAWTGCGSRTTPATPRSASRIGPSRSRRRGPSSSASRRSPAPRPATWPARRPRRRPPPRPAGLRLHPGRSRAGQGRPRARLRRDRRPDRGTYDDVNRLCLEVADETGWGFVNINLRPFYAEGSKTLAFEIAESLGWRSPDVIVAPRGVRGDVHPGRARVRGAGRAGPHRAPADPVRGRPGGRLRPGRDGLGGRHGRDRAGPLAGHDRALAGDRQSGRWAVRASSSPTRPAVRSRRSRTPRRPPPSGTSRRLEGIYPETAGGVTLAAAAAARRRGTIRRGDEVVALLTGNGLKTPDARLLGLGDGVARPGRPGLAPSIRPSLAAFERWLDGGRA